MGVFFKQGQICAAGTRILVQRGIAEQFAGMLAGAAKSIKVGDPAEAGVQMGPVAKKGQFERVNRYISQGVAEGAKLLAGGETQQTIRLSRRDCERLLDLLDNPPTPNARFKAAMKRYGKAKQVDVKRPNADRSFNWQP